MSCLVCQNRIPLLRQRAGNRFCSDAHSNQHANLQKPAVASRSQYHLVPARFANQPGTAAQGLTATRMFRKPIPRFSDVILSRRFIKIARRAVKGARTVASVPSAFPSRAVHPSHSRDPEIRVRLSLTQAAAAAPGVALRLSNLSGTEVAATGCNPPLSACSHATWAAIIPKMPWSGPLLASIGGLKPASALCQRASEGDLDARAAVGPGAPIKFRPRLESE